jgi:hypothetical protein
MFVELDNTNQFVQYHTLITQVAPEHANYVIQVTDALYQLLINIVPWGLVTIDTTKVYDTPDIALFVEIITTPVVPTLQSLQAQLTALTQQIASFTAN